MTVFAAKAPIRVGVIGHTTIFDCIARAYAELPNVQLAAVYDAHEANAARMARVAGLSEPAGDWRAVVDAVDAVEILAAAEDHAEMAEYASARGKHLAIHKPLARTLADAQRITEAVQRGGVIALVLDPLLFHPLVQHAKQLLDDEQVGEIQMIRMKSHVGASGGMGPAINIARLSGLDANPLLEPAFDKAALIETLAGPVLEVFCYAGEGTRLVSLKFAAAGRYGIHEAVYSPQLVVQSATVPVDNSLEITGTDGILWVRNLTATMVEAPKLMLKRKDQVTVWDDRVEYEFPRVLRDVRAHFVDCLRGGAQPLHDLVAAQRALAVNCAAHVSLVESRAVTVASLGVG